MNSLRQLYSLFDRRERGRLAMLTGLMIVAGFLEVFGIGLIFPYIAILQDAGKITSNHYLSAVYQGLGFGSTRVFCVYMSFGLLAVFLVKALFSLWMNSFQMRFVCSKQNDLGEKLFSSYLFRPYTFFLAANTSTLIGNLTLSLFQLAGALQGILTLGAEATASAGVVLFLLYLSPIFSVLSLVLVSLFCFTFLRFIRARVAAYAVECDTQTKNMIRTANESLSSAKELQVLGRQQYFVQNYGRQGRLYWSAISKSSLLGLLPRVFLETLAIGGMVFCAVSALLSGQVEKNLFSVLAVFAVATVRIVPSANRILQAWNSIVSYAPAIDVVWRALNHKPAAAARLRANRAVSFQREIVMRINQFHYPGNPHFILGDIQLTIKRGEKIALIGHSGSGKTTLVDLLLGLFPEFEGQILVDGTDIRDGLEQWRRSIGYIPQNIYLCDNTITRNVAFALPDAEIDLARVQRAVGLAGLQSVVRAQPNGLETVVGDRGIRLSGGERQRIGIARALYHDPELLILDEATSALDNETERQIVDAILGLGQPKTVIVIAHRLTTVKNCDCVYLMRGGRIIDQGRFVDLAARNPDFVNPPAGSSNREFHNALQRS